MSMKHWSHIIKFHTGASIHSLDLCAFGWAPKLHIASPQGYIIETQHHESHEMDTLQLSVSATAQLTNGVIP